MNKFVRKFLLRMLIEAAPFAVIGTILVQMAFDSLEITHDYSAAPFIFALPLIMAAVVTTLTIFLAVHNTNLLRRYEFSLGKNRERIFYALLAILFILIAAGDLAFLLYKFLPFIDAKLVYAVRDAQIRNETPEVEAQMIEDLIHHGTVYRRLTFVSAGITHLLQSAAYFLSARKLVAIYRDPPDYWSGKKKGQKVRR